MSEEINQRVSHLDVLVNNAGVFKSPQGTTKDGFETRIAVNYFSPFLLTNKLIGKIKESEDPIIINLSSAAQSSVSSELLSNEIKVSEQEAYAQSKLAILMWSFYLAKEESKISVTALNPGSLLNTNMVREAYGKFWSSADKGANIIYDLALSSNSKDNDGKYFDNDKGDFGPAHPEAYDIVLINKLIENTDKHLKGYN